MTQTSITLPHLTNEMVLSARKTRLCSFSVALEGWRRGLKLKWYTSDSPHFQNMIIFGVNPPGRLFSLSSDKRTHYFFRTRGDKVANAAVEIGSEKDLTKKYLFNDGVPVPLGYGFDVTNKDEEIEQAAEKLGYPLVLKPTDGSLGKGVVTNIQTNEKMKKAIKYVRHSLGYEEVVLEQHIKGEEYRFYVVEDEVIAVYNRVPANIIGDGVHTVEELIALKNLERKKNSRLHSCLIEIDEEILEFLEDAEYGFNDVPPEGKKIYLREKTNVSSGGDPIDVTDEIDDYYKDVAVRALKAVPGLPHGGVDIIIDHSKPKESAAAVIELNPTAQIGGILFPLNGKSRDIPKAIVDYYFPETVGTTIDSGIYFDLSTTLEALENRSALEVEVSKAPSKELYVEKWRIHGIVNKTSFKNSVRNFALTHKIHGELSRSYANEVELVLGVEKKELFEEMERLMINHPSAEIEKIERFKWIEPIKIGFEVNETYNVKRAASVTQALKKVRRQHKKIRKETYQLEKDNIRINTSTSMKLSNSFKKMTGKK